MTGSTITEKIERLRAGHSPRVLDLFSGCGGLSLGFRAAGYKIAGAVESDHYAAASHGQNFHAGEDAHCSPRDMETRPSELAMALGLVPVSRSVDVLIGGPPCQSFSRIGRAKLRDLRQHPEAFRHDPRARLYLRYLAYVEAFRPLAILIENVPDVIRFGGQNIPEEICEVLERTGYRGAYTLLNAVHYGVPQYRERMFLIAYRRELDIAVSFPGPTHGARLPEGYLEYRKSMLNGLLSGDLLGPRSHALEPPDWTGDLRRAVSVEEALHDLPPMTDHVDGQRNPPGPKEKGIVRRYDRRRRVSDYARLMKEWPGFESREGVTDHVTRCLPRDWKLFAAMHEGDRYPEAHRLAEALFERELAQRTDRGEHVQPDSDSWRKLRKSFVPPYPTDKFPDKWRKMVRAEPARTIMAHLSRDCYSHIHYDSAQARTLSIREAARLQSFPDGFVFVGSMRAAFRQIGNAVPPLLAQALAAHIRSALEEGIRPAFGESVLVEAAKQDAACHPAS